MQMKYRASLWMHAWWLFFLTVRSQSLTCDSSDLASLIGFASGLDNPSPLTSWTANASLNCCNWTGVECRLALNSGQRVTHLNLANKNLSGSISNSIGALDQLISLNLSQNSLKGVVPLGIFQLQSLKVLDLSMNDLSGPIAANITLTSIQVFNVSGNMFDGSLPILASSKTLNLFDVSNNLLSGGIGAEICNASPGVQFIYLSNNLFSGELPVGFGNCSSLRELSLDMNKISGNLPEDIFKLKSLSKLNFEKNQLFGRLSDRISNLSNLQQLDFSLNNFYGNIPNVVGNLSVLQCFCAESNRFSGEIPASLSNLLELGVLNLRNNSLSGEINLNFTRMARLTSLDLGSNSFSGMIPPDLSNCLELQTLNLASNLLTGGIPESFKNLISLTFLSLSRNLLSNLNEALGVLQNCPKLTNLVLTKNFNDGKEIPIEGIQGFPNIEVLALPNCGLSGSIPAWLQNCTKLKVLDLSWNNLSGPIPPWLGDFNYLFYLDLSNNSLGGEIPDGFTEMKGLRSKANLQQSTSLNDFPFFIKKNNTGKGLQYNQVSSFPPSLILSNNMLVGSIPKGFGNLKALHQLDLSKNRLSGAIPEEISGLSSLELLDLSHNNLTGNIPSSLTKLTFLSRFIVAFNNLVGSVPIGGQFSTFSAADFQGNPGLCYFHSPACARVESTQSRSRRGKKNKGLIIGMTFGIGLGTSLLLVIVYLIVSRNHSSKGEERFKQVADSGHLETASSKLVILFKNKDKQELSISDIMKATGNFDQSNIIGCGGFGLVYKAILPDGSKVAIKRLSGDYGQMDREFQAEVETLSRAQHENLVLLQGYCKFRNDRLLIYTFMENGSLDYWLHEKLDGGSTLDWNTRLQIAQGAARGLAYLHQSCQPHILHRDIKSSNILLNGKFEAHLADFGLARLILPYNTHVTTDLVGTLGYIPPEYGQSSVATYRGDVYSFGVVLLELLTGKRPVDMTKPKSCRDLISWVFQMRKEGKETIVLDRLIYIKENEGQMLKMLEIACICLSESPRNRPLTQQLVEWLNTIGRDNQSVENNTSL